MTITIDHTPVEVHEDETLLEAARRTGHDIPSLCYAKGAKHRSSCMVCAVMNRTNGQIIPSCTTRPVEGMQIETGGEEVRLVRTLSLELLLSDHRADCEAPCSAVCPNGLDVEQMLGYYDAGRYAEAHAVIAGAFALPGTGCDTCKASCEKACRRGTVDGAVAIRQIIREIIGMPGLEDSVAPAVPQYRVDKRLFNSRLGRFTEKEKEGLASATPTPSRCLHCACAGKETCRLRLYATAQGIKRTRYQAASTLPVMNRVHVNGRLWFEPGKCIRCGLCVYNSANGFTFRDRGFVMQVVIPEANRPNATEDLAELCPTGALYLTKSTSDTL